MLALYEKTNQIDSLNKVVSLKVQWLGYAQLSKPIWYPREMAIAIQTAEAPTQLIVGEAVSYAYLRLILNLLLLCLLILLRLPNGHYILKEPMVQHWHLC